MLIRLHLFLSFLLLLSSVLAQFTTTSVPTYAPSHAKRAAAAASTFTVETLTANLLATKSLNLPSGPSASPILEQDLAIQTGYVINNFSKDYNAVCWYPVSVCASSAPCNHIFH